MDVAGQGDALEGMAPAVAGVDDLPWPEYLESVAHDHDVWPMPVNTGWPSDNGAIQGFDVPNANLIYWHPDAEPGAHYGGHLHDPYGDMDLLLREIGTLTEMVHIAL